MNSKILLKGWKVLLLAVTALALAAAPSFAQTTIDLCATTGTVAMPDGAIVDIWGFVEATSCTAGDATLPGPVLRPTPGDTTLTINLTNNLSEAVSFFVPGLRPTTATGIAGMFTAEAGPSGGTASYTFNLTNKTGSHLYHSATSRIRTQVPMGLYGALVVDSATGEAYPPTATQSAVFYDQDKVLVYSEIDPNLNADPTGFDGAKVINWNPQYFLINGDAHPATADITINTSEDVLLRFVNAGLQTYAPTLDGGLYMALKAEDGNRSPHTLEQYGIELQAGKTIDALINAGTAGTYALYDRAASYGGGISHIIAGVVAGAPTAVDDNYATDEDVVLNVAVPGVLGNDTPGTGGTMTASLVSDVSAGTLTLNADGSFTYTPNVDFTGTDIFTYFANDGGPNSNVATVTITVSPTNDAPVAVPDYYDEEEGAVLSVAAPGVLTNDTDVDGDSLTAVYVSGPDVTVDADLSAAGPGVLNLNGDGSFSHDPTGTGLNAGDQVTFDYKANDSALDSNVVTVTLTVVPPAANIAPFANDDFAEVIRNSGATDAANTFSVTANDVDADGTIDVTTVVITTGPNTQRGGTVVENGDGTVTYVPKRGFRGTDTFQYTVNDDDGAISNVATVSVNVVK